MDFSKKTLVELREIAKEKGLKGITALRKPELFPRKRKESRRLCRRERWRESRFPREHRWNVRQDR